MTSTTPRADLAASLAREIPGLELATDPAAIAAKSRDYWMRSLLQSCLDARVAHQPPTLEISID